MRRRGRITLKEKSGSRCVCPSIDCVFHACQGWCFFPFRSINILLMFFVRQTLTRLACSLLSLPVPHANSHGPRDEAPYTARTVPNYWETKRIQKLLLIGPQGSGTSTIFKQVRSCSFLLKSLTGLL